MWSCEGGEVGEGGDDDAGGELGEEGGDAQAVGGDAVGVGAVDAFDEAFEAESAQVVGGLGGGVVGLPEGGHLGAQGLVGEAADDVGEGGDGAEQGHGARFAEAQAGGALAVVDGGQHDRFEGGGIGKAGLSFAERGEEPGVGVGPDAAQRPPVVGVERLVDGEVVGVVDRRLDPQGPALFEVGLGLGRLVVDLQLGGDVTGDHLGGETSRRLAACRG